MGTRLNGQSLFTGISAGINNTFAQLSGQYTDGLTLENLQKSLTNSNNILNTQYGATFASYLSGNFKNFDKDGNGVISADEVQSYMNNIATQGLTREQIATLAGTGMSSSLQETVLNHFDDIDTNHDGKVTNQEIQAYGVNSDVEKRKISDQNRMINNMSMFYGGETNYEGSLLDYKYLSDDNK